MAELITNYREQRALLETLMLSAKQEIHRFLRIPSFTNVILRIFSLFLTLVRWIQSSSNPVSHDKVQYYGTRVAQL